MATLTTGQLKNAKHHLEAAVSSIGIAAHHLLPHTYATVDECNAWERVSDAKYMIVSLKNAIADRLDITTSRNNDE